MNFECHNDTIPVILEVESESSKATVDSEVCSLRQLLMELENEGIVDCSVNGHALVRPAATDSDVGWGLIHVYQLRKILFVFKGGIAFFELSGC